jgi:hypothetical protein
MKLRSYPEVLGSSPSPAAVGGPVNGNALYTSSGSGSAHKWPSKNKRKRSSLICEACTNRARNQLAEIPSLLDRLAYATVGSPPGLVEPVSGGGFASRLPLAIAALTLTAYTPEPIGLELVDPVPPVGAAGDSIPLWVVSGPIRPQPAGRRTSPPAGHARHQPGARRHHPARERAGRD